MPRTARSWDGGEVKARGSLVRSDGVITVGICAREKKSKSKHMRSIISKFDPARFEVIVWTDHCILEQQVEEWPLCDALIAFFSAGFPLEKAEEYVRLRQPYTLNDLKVQRLLQDRRWVYDTLRGAGVEGPPAVYVSRDGYGGVDPDSQVLVEGDDYIEVDGERMNKPFVEKPVDAENHNIHIYYPMSAGGGSKRLFRKVGDRSSEFYPHINEVRRDGSYVYERFVETQGTDVKVYTVGLNYGHAEARKSPALDGKVNRDRDGKEIRYPVILSAEEKNIASRVTLAFKQCVCGFDILRVQGRSLVCDVNGWSFVKNSRKYQEDCATLLSEFIEAAVKPSRRGPNFLTTAPLLKPFLTRSSHRSTPPSPTGSETASTSSKTGFNGDVTPQHGSPSNGVMGHHSGGGGGGGRARQRLSTLSTHREELRCVIAICRHGDRTPKQKLKMKAGFRQFLDYYHRHCGENPRSDLKVKGKIELKEFLSLTSEVIQEVGDKEGQDVLYKLYQIRHVLERWEISGINRKLQLKPQKWNDEDNDGAAAANGTREERLASSAFAAAEQGSDGAPAVVPAELPPQEAITAAATANAVDPASVNGQPDRRDTEASDVFLTAAAAAEAEAAEGKPLKQLRATELQLILKWGGELTKLGERQAIELGNAFRRAAYPDVEGGGVLRLHSTFRHDLKIRTSDEGRVMKTAAAFAKGFLELEGELTPILVSLVHKDKNSGMMLDQSGNKEIKEDMARQKAHLERAMSLDHELQEDELKALVPSAAESVLAALRKLGNPRKRLLELREQIADIVAQLEDLVASTPLGQVSDDRVSARDREMDRGDAEAKYATAGDLEGEADDASAATSGFAAGTGRAIVGPVGRFSSAESSASAVSSAAAAGDGSLAAEKQQQGEPPEPPSLPDGVWSSSSSSVDNNSASEKPSDLADKLAMSGDGKPTCSGEGGAEGGLGSLSLPTPPRAAEFPAPPLPPSLLDLHADVSPSVARRIARGETLLLMLDRWRKLYKELYNTKTGGFDITKVPDVHDNVRYDCLHNEQLGLRGMTQLYDLAKSLADAVVPQEYGITVHDKLLIGSKMCWALLEKIKYDLIIARSNDEADMRYQIDVNHADDLPINSLGRRVRTRLYFTSESHLHTLLNVLRYPINGHEPLVTSESARMLSRTKEMCYLTTFVIRLFEDLEKDSGDPERFRAEILFSPGVVAHPSLAGDHLHTAPLVPLHKHLTSGHLESVLDEAIALGAKEHLQQAAADHEAELQRMCAVVDAAASGGGSGGGLEGEKAGVRDRRGSDDSAGSRKSMSLGVGVAAAAAAALGVGAALLSRRR